LWAIFVGLFSGKQMAFPRTGGCSAKSYTSDDLWFEITCVTNYTANFIVHSPDAEATNGVYDLFMTTNLSPDVPGLNLTNWLWLLRTDPGQTNLTVPDLTSDQAYFLLARTNDADGDGMSDAYEQLVSHTSPTNADAPIITFQPLSQTVYSGDTVTFSVTAEGAQPLSYQWGSNGVALVGETNAALTLAAVQVSQAADYSVLVTSPAVLSTLSSNATLTVYDSSGMGFIPVIGPRQDFTFKRGPTYLIYSPVELYGHTVIQGASVIKFDTWTNSTLQIKGSLTTDTTAYAPGMLTCMDDNSVGIPISNSSGSPLTATNHCAYLDLSGAQGWQSTLSNLRCSYADQGVTTPVGAARLDLWHCQFVQCASAVVNAVTNGPTSAGLHNVLFAACQSAMLVAGNAVAVAGEHITADVGTFWTGETPPVSLRLTNSIIIGSVASGPDLITDHCAINPTPPVFQASAAGSYYLTNGSPYQSGATTNISARLVADLGQKTTQPPLAFPNQMTVSGELTLLPQAARDIGGTLALGYHYDALDYTVATLTLQGATVTVEPGTAIAVRSDPWPDMPGYFSYIGFDLCNGARLAGSGTPTRPIVFTTVRLVQEQPCPLNYCANLLPDLPLDGDTPPALDFRFCNFYFGSEDYQVLAGMTWYYGWTPSDNSSLNWSLRDCSLRGGAINLGYPGSYFDEMLPPGSVSWVNNVFEQVDINLDPAYYWINEVVNVDLPFQASNNLFRRGRLRLVPIPTSGGNWALRDNLFERVVFQQDTDLPLDHDHNAYWPCSQSELAAAWVDAYGPDSTSQLGADTGGTTYPASNQTLAAAPPYQTGPFGDYYLPNSTPLFGVGSRSAADAGLFHYTTRVDQIKEGQESSGHMINIGLHYVATASSASFLPKDTDADGIPDYVENWHGDGAYTNHTDTETDWQNAYTVTGVYDPTSAVYDTVDLDGDGLTGLLERFLGTDPLTPDNPLVLPAVQAGSGLIDIPLAIPTAAGSNGALRVYLNGQEPSGGSIVQGADGAWHLQLDTSPLLNGTYCLQLGLSYAEDFQHWQTALGSPCLLQVSNLVTVYELSTFFTDLLHIEAGLNVPADGYEVDISDPDGNPLRTLTGTPQNGWISDSWNLTDGTNAIVSTSLLCDFYPVSNGVKAPQPTRVRYKQQGHIRGKSFAVAHNGAQFPNQRAVISANVVTMLRPGDGSSSLDYDLLPAGFNDAYSDNSFIWNGGTNSNKGTLTNALADANSGNFYWLGHGGPNSIGPTTNAGWGDTLASREVRALLINWGPVPWNSNILWNFHPYRLVILDGCQTWSKEWATTWGIPLLQTNTIADYAQMGLDPCAYVGWSAIQTNTISSAAGTAYGNCLNELFRRWYIGQTLADCMTAYTAKLMDPANTPRRINSETWHVAGCTNLTTFIR
jgi:hypothetical protein